MIRALTVTAASLVCSAMLPAQDIIVSGIIRDESHGATIGGATIEVLGAQRRTTSRNDGAFTIHVPGPTASLAIRRLGYWSIVLDVQVDTARHLDVRLRPYPAQLMGIVVPGVRTAPFSTTLTRETIRHAPALVEPDVIRALPFVPGVLQPNDLIGSVHLAGAAGDETGLLLDGHPLQFPSHLGGIFGALNVASLDRADVFIHHVPSAMDTRNGGVISLRTRQIDSRQPREALLSLLAASVTASQFRLTEHLSGLVTGRVTYVDRLLRALSDSATFGGEDLWAPTYRDGLLRLDGQLPKTWSSELLVYGTEDTPQSLSKSGSSRVPRFQWGESLFGLTLRKDLGAAGALQARVSRDHAFTHDRSMISDTLGASDAVMNSQKWSSGQLVFTNMLRALRVTTGFAVDRRDHTHWWPSGDRFRNEAFGAIPMVSRSQTMLSGTVEALWERDRWNATAGGRVHRVAGASFVAPRFSVEWKRDRRLAVLLAADRRFQFDAQPGTPQPGALPQPTLLLDVPRRADMLSAGVEIGTDSARSLKPSFTLTAFSRHFANRVIAPSGHSVDFSMPSLGLRRVSASSVGASMGMALTSSSGLVTQAAYTYQRARQRDGKNTPYPAAWDTPHILTLFSSTPVGKGFVVTAALQMHSGVAVTPVQGVLPVASALRTELVFPRLLYGAPNSARLPGYRRADLAVRKTWRRGTSAWTGVFQVLNATYRDNPVDIDWFSVLRDRQSGTAGNALISGRNGLPLIPSIGLEVLW